MQEDTLSDLNFMRAPKELIQARSLQKRVDTKFLVCSEEFKTLLQECKQGYALVKARGREMASYRTRYFDTEDLQCLTDHHRGRRPRYKFRFRHYLDREKTFFEVKVKTPANRTRKTRLEVDYRKEHLGSEEIGLVQEFSSMNPALLTPGLGVEFSRLMLVGKETMERVTFDIHFRAELGGKHMGFPHIVIAELKQARLMARSPVMLALRKFGRRIDSMSKYCVGSMLVRPNVSLQRYKPTVRLLRSFS